MRSVYKKLTYEDKFSRNFGCNVRRWLPYIKKSNRKKARRLLKQEAVKEIQGIEPVNKKEIL